MLLDIAAVMALALSCAPGVAPEQLAAIAKTESGFQTLTIHDNTARKSYRPADKSTAMSLAENLLGDGHSLDVGIMQINSSNFRWLGLTLQDAFEPCPSIKAGADVLTAVSRYNTGNSRDGFSNGYVRRVLTAGADIKGIEAAESATGASAKAIPPVPHDWDVFPDEPQSERGRSEAVPTLEEDASTTASSSGDGMSRVPQDLK